VHSNVSQEVIEITSDKPTLILTKHVDSLEKNKEWQLPLSLIVTILLVLSTTNFKASFGVSEDTWASIFILSCGISTLWLLRTLWHKKKGMTVEDILKAVKNKT
jgi:uncharacterized membrane protein